MVDGGNCKFTRKANFAEAVGASAVLIINNQKELHKMVCEPDETDLDILIPAVMLPQDAGVTLEKMLSNGSFGESCCVGTLLLSCAFMYDIFWNISGWQTRRR